MNKPIVITIENYKDENYTYVIPSDTQIETYKEEAMYDGNQKEKLICLELKIINEEEGIQEIISKEEKAID